MISIAIEDRTVAVGELLKAQIHWVAEGGTPRRIIVAAEWATGGQGDRARGLGRSFVFVPRGNDREAMFPVRLLIPFEGPVSYEGPLISIEWKLHVRVERPGFDELESEVFRVEPRRRRPTA